MSLTRYKLKDLIEPCEERNSNLKFGLESVKGISTEKEFITTKANMDGVGLKSYKLVLKNEFAYVADTSRRGDKVALAFNDKDETILISSIYSVFKVQKINLLLPDYLFMYFNRPEFDRYARFSSWGSARETFSFEEMCEIEIDLPQLEIQQKFVDIYKALQTNLNAFEKGSTDLKLLCDAYIENLRHQMPSQRIGQYLQSVNEINVKKEFSDAQGVEASGSFIYTRANMDGVDISKYTIVRKDNIAYNPSRINLGSIAIYSDEKPCIVSPMYVVFKVVDENEILPLYLMLWLKRKEFQRLTWYFAAGSVRDTFDFNLMQEVKIPIPNLEIQKAIVAIYEAYNKRKELCQSLKIQLKELCPVLIQGALKEAREKR